jgi:ATP synthase subunit 6
MQFLYSPLEQFEPIPFITLYLSNVNLSITSISIMFIYVLFILVFFLNGYVFEPALSSNLITSKDKNGAVILKTTSEKSLLKLDMPLLSSSLTKEISYFSFLVNRSATFYSISDEKAAWVSSPLQHSSLRNRYSVIFYKGFYTLLSTQQMKFPANFSYFSEIKAIILDFLTTFTGTSKSLNDNFLAAKSSQSFYSFSSNAVKDTYSNTFVPKVNLFFFEAIYETILNGMVKSILGSDKRSISFFPIVFTIFLFLLISNVAGLVPYGSTVTAYLVVTLTLSIMVMFGVTVYAFQNHGILFFGHFLPSGTPGWLIPLIIPIEIISFVFRVVSLSVRLFANMFAGHTLFAVLAGFGWAMATGGIMIAIASPLPVLVVFILTGLETFVALIQAYVFTILTCIYFEEAINMH